MVTKFLPPKRSKAKDIASGIISISTTNLVFRKVIHKALTEGVFKLADKEVLKIVIDIDSFPAMEMDMS